MIIGISGLCIDAEGNVRTAGAGKDEVTRQLLARHSFVSLAWADPMKRFLQEVFEFTDEQLWGDSDKRVQPDPRYVRMPAGYLGTSLDQPNPPVDRFLTPRFALQSLGEEWGRRCYKDTWVMLGIRTIQRLQAGGYTYSPQQGLRSCCYIDSDTARPKTRVVVSDLRYFNEAVGIQAAGGKLVRVRRTVPHIFAEQQMDNNHQSEVELPTWDDDRFDYIIENDGDSLRLLGLQVDQMVAVLSGRVAPYDAEQADVPPCKRAK